MRKLSRKILSALLALTLLVSLLPIGVQPAQAEGLTIKIYSKYDLWDFSYALSQNTAGYANANVSLEQNIDLGSAAWVPIGTNYLPSMGPITFTGTFDGNGHTINNIHIVDRTYNPTPADDYRSSPDVGLFARLGSGGTVKNLKVTGSVSGGERGVNVGGIVGANNRGTVTNCTFSGSVNGGSATNVGGIVGQNGIGGSVTDCSNSGGVSGNGDVGGVVGDNSGSVTNCTNDVDFGISGSGNFGGVVGNNIGSVTNCSNSGRISVPMTTPPSSASGNLGGVVGQNSGADAKITSCYNTGGLLYYKDNSPKGSFSGNLGGVVGSNIDNSSVTNCYSTGDIGSDHPIPEYGTFGGVVGSNSGNSSVTNCYNSGKFGSFINSTVGGVIGSNTDTSNVTNCYFLQQDNVPAQGIGSGETTGATPVDDLTKQEQFSDWDFANIWRISQSLNCPVLQENAQDGLPPGLGTADSPYRISTADELAAFRDRVNDGSEQSAHAKLMNNIDLNGSVTNQWTPIGTSSSQYTGNFNGQNFKISGLYINTNTDYQGLFGYVGTNGKIENLTVSGSVSGSNYVGGIVGYNQYGTVESRTNTGNASVSGSSYVGGVAGRNDGTVRNCYNTASVSGDSTIGGVVGYNGDTVTNCYNTGEVSGSDSGGSDMVGGVVGCNYLSVLNCYFLQTDTVNVDLPGIGEYNDTTNIATATAKDEAAFHSGEVAHLLGEAWGQDLSTDDSWPTLIALDDSAQPVYKVTVVYGDYADAPETETSYTNNPTEPAAPSRDGYTFDRWDKTGEGTTTITYTAKWTENAPDPDPEPTPEPDPTPTPTPDPEPTPEGPSTEGSAGWEDIAGEIEDAEEGDEITIDMGDETKVPAEIFESVAGKDVDVTFDLGDDLSWTVNGKDIPDDAALADLDLGVALDTDGIPANVVNAITGEVGTVQITLAHDGEFGFTMTLSAPLGKENAGYWANLYHYDEEAEKLNFEAAAEIDEDGNVKIPFTHASQYAIVIDDHSHATVPVSEIFIDIAPDAWYKDAVQYAYDNGLMTGVSATEFAPEATTTRAMIVSILARLEGVESAEAAGFADVSDEWYATAVNWAANVGVVNGYEDNTFRPNTAITREQLAAMLMNYSAWKGEDVSARADLSTYSDAATISSWANDVMQWAVAEGLISGMTEDTLQPQGNATRAQVAAILQRFLDK